MWAFCVVALKVKRKTRRWRTKSRGWLRRSGRVTSKSTCKQQEETLISDSQQSLTTGGHVLGFSLKVKRRIGQGKRNNHREPTF
jgi:hypothetical protein